MAASPSAQAPDYFGSRPLPRSRPSLLGGSPRTPRTPLMGRSISGQFNSPGASFSREQEEIIVYELHPRYLSAGLAGESTPRCVHRFGYQVGDGRRVGDYREFAPDPESKRKVRVPAMDDPKWTANYELFSADVRRLDLGLVEDVLERAIRAIHTDFLQLDPKPRRVVLAVPSLLSTPILDIALRVLFHHHAQPPSVTLLTTPTLACVGAGLRSALVVEIGWEETVVTAVGEYKPAAEKRTTRGGKMLTRELGGLLEKVAKPELVLKPSFAFAEDVTQRMAWCKSTQVEEDSEITIPVPDSIPHRTISVPFSQLSEPAEQVFFSSDLPASSHDDSDLPLHLLAYRALLTLPVDLRATCMSRIVLTGSSSAIPGLRHRLLRELTTLVEARGWDSVHSYGSAKSPLPHRLRAKLSKNSNMPVPPYRPPTLAPPTSTPNPSSSSPLVSTPTGPQTPTPASRPTTAESTPSESSSGIATPPLPSPSDRATPTQDSPHLPTHQIAPDDLSNPLSQRIARERQKGKAAAPHGVIRGVETLGAWAGASLFASLTKGGVGVKGVLEVEREEFLKNGVKDGLIF